MPLGPSIITSRTSCRVAPIRARRPPSLRASAWSAIHDAPARVLPAPRPPSTSQVDQVPPSSALSGGVWCGCRMRGAGGGPVGAGSGAGGSSSAGSGAASASSSGPGASWYWRSSAPVMPSCWATMLRMLQSRLTSAASSAARRSQIWRSSFTMVPNRSDGSTSKPCTRRAPLADQSHQCGAIVRDGDGGPVDGGWMPALSSPVVCPPGRADGKSCPVLALAGHSHPYQPFTRPAFGAALGSAPDFEAGRPRP